MMNEIAVRGNMDISIDGGDELTRMRDTLYSVKNRQLPSNPIELLNLCSQYEDDMNSIVSKFKLSNRYVLGVGIQTFKLMRDDGTLADRLRLSLDSAFWGQKTENLAPKRLEEAESKILDIISASENHNRISDKNIYSLFDVPERTAKRAIRLIADIDGIQSLIDMYPESSDERRVLEQYRDAMMGIPDFSGIIQKAEGFGGSEEHIMSAEEEAYVFDDALAYYSNQDKDMKVSDLKKYLKKLYKINPEEPWTVNRDAVESYDEDEAKRRARLKRVRANRKARTTPKAAKDDKQGGEDTWEDMSDVDAENIEAMSPGNKLAFMEWYFYVKLDKDMPKTPNIVLQDNIAELVEYDEVWKKHKGKLYSIGHQDKGGELELHRMLNVINNIMEHKRSIERRKRALEEWNNVQSTLLEREDVKELAKEWLEYEKTKMKEDTDGK